MNARRPHLVLGIATALLTALLVAFAVALLHGHNKDREAAQGRFRDRAQIAAQLTQAIFTAASASGAADATKALGGPTIDPKVLDRRVKLNQQLWQVVYAPDGSTLAASKNAPAAARAGVNGQYKVAEILKGQPWALSDTDASGAMSFTQAFRDATGKPRVVVSGFPPTVISQFLALYLNGLPAPHGTTSYVADSKGNVVGSPDTKAKPGSRVPDPGLLNAIVTSSGSGTYKLDGKERTYTVAPVKDATWKVALSVPSSVLYAGISSTVSWMILIALAIAGLIALAALSRSLQAAEAVRVANQQLEVSNDELEQSNVELQRSNAELEQFASVASHDLQEPLRKVQAFGDQLERRFGEDIPEEGIEYLRRMRSAASRMSVLIDDLLRFSRVTTRALPHERVDLRRVANEVISDLDAPLAESQGSVDVGDLPTVIADPLQMRQLMQNLIANAIKFHRPGVAPAVRIEAANASRPGMIAFAVSDNGIGFEEEYSERIFRVFERLHSRDVYAGTGIGLALCRKIAERHGGTILAESTPDQGSRFTVVLPAAGVAVDGGADTSQRQPAHV